MEPKSPRLSTGDSRQSTPLGIWIFVPGYPQWSWSQRERAFVLLGSYLAALGVGVFTWGSPISLGVLGFAFLIHVFSAADSIHQSSFPGFGRMVPVVSASAGLGAVCYTPALVMATIYAWPIALDDRPRDGYLVNRRAYDSGSPVAGQTVWLRPAREPRPRVARVVAGSGQRVEWVGGEFRVDGQKVEDSPLGVAGSPRELKLEVPEGHVLVAFGAERRLPDGGPGGWEIVDRSDIRGRAWARSYPIWDRRLLN